jgi:2C-methyl-D-erythritol 2,4-cyclodiphosphate synthase
MYSNLIRDTIQMDKKARESVEELKFKKENLDQLVKEEEQKLKKEMKFHIQDNVKNLKNKYIDEIRVKHEQEKKKFDAALNELILVFEREKDQWIEAIYQSCTK